WSWKIDWVARAHDGSVDPDLANGFPGVGQFVDNTKPPYNEADDPPEVAVVVNGFLYIVNGKTGRLMKSPADGTTDLKFHLFTSRGGAPNIADFDGDGHVEVSFAGTGCMIVVDPDCAVGSAAARDALATTAGSGCAVKRADVTQCTIGVD